MFGKGSSCAKYYTCLSSEILSNPWNFLSMFLYLTTVDTNFSENAKLYIHLLCMGFLFSFSEVVKIMISIAQRF